MPIVQQALQRFLMVSIRFGGSKGDIVWVAHFTRQLPRIPVESLLMVSRGTAIWLASYMK